MAALADIDEVIERWDVDGEIRLALTFCGTVQGVGFRWTMQALARQAGVGGWVRNMDDGTVTAELQGTGHACTRVLAGIRDQFADARSRYEFLRRMGLGFSVASCEQIACHEAVDGHTDFEVRI